MIDILKYLGFPAKEEQYRFKAERGTVSGTYYCIYFKRPGSRTWVKCLKDNGCDIYLRKYPAKKYIIKALSDIKSFEQRQLNIKTDLEVLAKEEMQFSIAESEIKMDQALK